VVVAKKLKKAENSFGVIIQEYYRKRQRRRKKNLSKKHGIYLELEKKEANKQKNDGKIQSTEKSTKKQ